MEELTLSSHSIITSSVTQNPSDASKYEFDVDVFYPRQYRFRIMSKSTDTNGVEVTHLETVVLNVICG